jgi:probable rRNA maturation factor
MTLGRLPGISAGREKLVIVRKKIAGLSSRTLERFVLRARRAVRLRGPVDVLVAGNYELRVLNRRFRGKDKATDVLSFPSPVDVLSPKQPAGELAISLDIAKVNARKLGHPVAEEIKILVLHGILHLAGFDHEQDHGEMAREEIRLRRQLKLELGLIERTQVRTVKTGLSPNGGIRHPRRSPARPRTA